MEVRAERKNCKFANDSHRKHGFILRVILSLTVICLLAGGLVWKFGQKTTLAAGYNMEKGSDGRYVFNVVEVVPDKSQAVLGFFIGSEENNPVETPITIEQMNTLVKDASYDPDKNWTNFFYWPGSSQSLRAFQPYSVVTGANSIKTVLNNEIFKLRLLGVGAYDENKSPYENRTSEANKQALAEFDIKYRIKYTAVTPAELEDMFAGGADPKIHYLHVGGWIQLKYYPALYGTIYDWNKTPSDVQNYNNAGDISYSVALKLYEKAISDQEKMSVSLSSYMMRNTNTTKNLYKFYQMLNCADDPKDFKRVFKTTGNLATKDLFIDENGTVSSNYWGSIQTTNAWNDEVLKGLNWEKTDVAWNGNGNGSLKRFGDQLSNYIPEKQKNILLYFQNSYSFDIGGYLDQIGSLGSINEIIKFDPPIIPPVEEKRIGVKVLEIQPCNSFWTPENKTQLAKALGMVGKESEISLTCVTPNQLNGMAVDLTAEFDLIIVGDNVNRFSSGSGFVTSLYSHIGELSDAIVPDTLINGLMESDYTSENEFNQLLKTSGSPLLLHKNGYIGDKFLKNVGMTLELASLAKTGNPTDYVSKARVSGNDINKYMQQQLAEYVNSGQPVVAASAVHKLVKAQSASFNEIDRSKNPPENTTVYKENSRLFFALLGIADETKHYAGEGDPIPEALPSNCQTTLETVKTTDSTAVTLLDMYKPMITIKDTEAGAQPTISEQYSDTTKLKTLAKSNTLSFKYEITLPGGKIEDYKMTVVIDRNGDGVFDEKGAGGKPDNVNATIRYDKVYTANFKDLKNTAGFSISGNTVAGTFTTPAGDMIEPIEEFYEFRVIVSSNLSNGKLRSVWTGYMRPDLSKRAVKILQITPYADSPTLGANPITHQVPNEQFQKLFNDLTEAGSLDYLDGKEEYIFDLTTNFKAVSESEFAEQCAQGAITLKILEQYDLIICGTDFGSSQSSIVDLDEEAAVKILNEYMSVSQRPIIFTNDFPSYVNAENYVTTKKEAVGYKALVRPVWKSADGRKQVNYFLGYDEGSGKNWPDKLIPVPAWEENVDYHTQPPETIEVTPSQFEEVVDISVINGSLSSSAASENPRYNHNFNVGFLTENEIRALYEDGSGNVRMQNYQIKLDSYQSGRNNKYFSRYMDLHASLNLDENIPMEWVDTTNPVVIAGETYYHFTYPSNGKQYLALKSNTAFNYLLRSVAGNSNALYPEKGVWNYRATQSLRHALGMDRFGVTQPKAEKRDTGTCRHYQKIDELQGFTNGALLEYAYPKVSDYDLQGRFSRYPYRDEAGSPLKLGTKPRTNVIEKLNDGVIGHYPFEIAGDINNLSETKIKVQMNHPPLYELDLMRETGNGKIDDVTVWYTLGNVGTEASHSEIEASRYFEITGKDAGNNYYLYSKGKAFYTGFSLHKDVKAEEMEMKLFINTIFAALSSAATTGNSIYEAVVNPIGTVSNISRSPAPGTNNQYVCYFDEFDEKVTFQFRIQKPLAAAGETTPVLIGFKKPGEVLSLEPVLTDQECGLSPGITELFPVEIAPEQGNGGAPTDSGKWYTVSLSPAALDGKTLVIASSVKDMAGGKLINETAIHAEIRLVKRDSFELD